MCPSVDREDFSRNYKFVLFDLDNTLYDECSYLDAAYELCGAVVSSKHPNVDARKFSAFLRDRFHLLGRQRLFQNACTHFDLPVTAVDAMMSSLRSVRIENGLEIIPEMASLLQRLHERGVPTAIVTNGNLDQQVNKVWHLRPNDLIEQIPVYYCAKYRPKPAPDAVIAALEDHQVRAGDAVFIGDSDVDEQSATSAGVDFVNVQSLLSAPLRS